MDGFLFMESSELWELTGGGVGRQCAYNMSAEF